ncbi:MAG TPA: hypothetical protein VMF58_16785 [Rhizomicrobium sp.]|nr:hypothetical protein [Rhizomicrobium sp.]
MLSALTNIAWLVFACSSLLLVSVAYSIAMNGVLAVTWRNVVGYSSNLSNVTQRVFDNIISIKTNLEKLESQALRSILVDLMTLPLAARLYADRNRFVREAFGQIRVIDPQIVLYHLKEDAYCLDQIDFTDARWNSNVVIARDEFSYHEHRTTANSEVASALKYFLKEYYHSRPHRVRDGWVYNFFLNRRAPAILDNESFLRENSFLVDLSNSQKYQERIEQIGRRGRWFWIAIRIVDLSSPMFSRRLFGLRRTALEVLCVAAELRRRCGELRNQIPYD